MLTVQTILVRDAPGQPVAQSSDIFDGQGRTAHWRTRRHVPQRLFPQPAALAALSGHRANDRSAEYAELSGRSRCAGLFDFVPSGLQPAEAPAAIYPG